ncbi:MAG: ATP-binding protein [Vampirovibrionales bacterium]|nr:ATP-binding protein [Vampirovibrionales bacterium]
MTSDNSPTGERIGTVFLVDDEPMVTVSIQTMLSLDTKHLVYSFNSSVEALLKLDAHRPDVVISDFSMPEMDGITFLQKVKETLPQATLILLTGYADKESAIQAINTVGIYRYIEKPWDNDELKLNIKNGLERAHLVSDLKDTIHQLSEAESQLRQTNQHLEALVETRTQDLQATYQKLQSIVRNSADGIIMLNADLDVTAINPTADAWLAMARKQTREAKPKQARLVDLLKLSSGKSIENILKPMLEPLADGQAHSQIIPEAFLGALPLEINISPLEGGGTDGGIVLMLRDITQRKDIERLRDDFMSTLTHDLRTPLAAAIQTLTFFLDGTVKRDEHEKREQLMQMLVQSMRDMLGLVNVLLEVYKYEAGQQRLVFDRMDIGNLLDGVCAELLALAGSREQTLTQALPASIPPIIADKQEIKRVLVNLIGNAIHHTPIKGSIEVSAHIAENENAQPELTIEIRDDGRGIPAHDIANLFKRFSQGTSNKRSSGSGLGLYLSQQIIDAHKGSIWVESEEGQGSRFFIRLPLASA